LAKKKGEGPKEESTQARCLDLSLREEEEIFQWLFLGGGGGGG